MPRKVSVFIARQLGFDVSMVMALSAINQLANLLALRSWGTLIDRLSDKTVLTVSAPAYILSSVAMIGVSQPHGHTFMVTWLVFLHGLIGMSVADVTLASTNIALKLSPKGSATAYVATNAMAIALAAGLAPIVGGLLADFFAAREMELLLRWTSPTGTIAVPLRLTHWDSYSLLAGALGLYALRGAPPLLDRGRRRDRQARDGREGRWPHPQGHPQQLELGRSAHDHQSAAAAHAGCPPQVQIRRMRGIDAE